MTILIIARHGNTFTSSQTPTRVGRHTDLPLVESGQAQAAAIGAYLAQQDLIPDFMYTSQLQRTIQTAQIAMGVMNISRPIHTMDMFNEIDYGPDENQPEDAVIARIGADAIDQWDRAAIVPPGWDVNPAQIEQDWLDFTDHIIQADNQAIGGSARPDHGQIHMVVTSNGIARFAPHITGDYDQFRRQYSIKLKTGALGIFIHDGTSWHPTQWNLRP